MTVRAPPVVAVAARRHAGGHAVDMKAAALLFFIIKLQDIIARNRAIRIGDGLVSCLVDVHDLEVLGVDRFDGQAPLDKAIGRCR